MNLVIEVTRKCNQCCNHCLRGEAQNVNIKNEYITSILEQLRQMNMYFDVTFSGGEPTLNLPAIQHYINECQRLNVSHSSFYIATNGNNLGIDFAELCLKLYAMSEEREMCKVELSNDLQHEYVSDTEKDIFNGLKFFSDKHEKPINYFDRNSGGILQENFAENSNEGRSMHVYEFDNFDDWQDHMFYLNCNGNIINGCDWSYSSQNNQDVIICHVDDFKTWINNFERESMLQNA